MTDRICLLSAGRRCGSQYVAHLIANNFGYLDILEPFTVRHRITVDLSENNLIYLLPSTYTDELIEDQYKRVLEVLEKANPKQPIIMKFFIGDLDPYYEKLFITELTRLGFTFFLNRRQNIENQLLSFAMANITNVWTKIDKVSAPTPVVKIDNFNDMTELYTKQISIFDERIRLLNFETKDTITYETAISDIERIAGGKINPYKFSIYKIANNDPYENILNADEVKSFIKSLIS
jgi:hypothetical protein